MTLIETGRFVRDNPTVATSEACPKSQRVVVVASLTWSLVCFRIDLLKAMVAGGHEVIALAPDDDADSVATLEGAGVRFARIPMARTGTNPFADLRTLASLYIQMRRLAPDVVLAYTMKPIVYGGIAARLAGVPRRFALFTGFGFLFGEGSHGLRTSAIRRLTIMLHRRALAGLDGAFAYNEADAEDIRKHDMMSVDTPLTMIDGSGVDIERFSPSLPRAAPPTFLLVSRLLWEKGIGEFVAAARLLKRDYPDARFQILGPFDPNPSMITRSEMDAWIAEGSIEYLGETRDVRPFLASSTVFVLPSYYREGIPRSLLEALAVGRPVITTDLPGCRETVRHGENGFRVPPRDVEALAGAMRAFLDDEVLAPMMGERSRLMAEERFDVRLINRKLLSAMDL